MAKLFEPKIVWLTAAVLISLIFGTIYTVSQQILRLNANDPQIQLAQDAATTLNNKKIPSIDISNRVDVANSLSPFIVIYSKSGKPIVGNGYLNGSLPNIPIGVLKNSEDKSYNFVTWQPNDQLRIASVEVSANNYFVLSGRSLREVEKRESTILHLTVIGWLVSIIVLSVSFYFIRPSNKVKN